MDCLLISSGLVQNVVTVDSLEAAADAYPGFDAYIERTGNVGAGWTYDGETFSPPQAFPVPTRVELTKYQFLARMPTAKRIAIRAAAKTDPIIDDAMLMLDMAAGVYADDPMTVQLVGYLQMQNYLTAEEAAAMLV